MLFLRSGLNVCAALGRNREGFEISFSCWKRNYTFFMDHSTVDQPNQYSHMLEGTSLGIKLSTRRTLPDLRAMERWFIVILPLCLWQFSTREIQISRLDEAF